MAKRRPQSFRKFTTVGRVEIEDFGPPIKLSIHGHPAQKVTVGQQVQVWLPYIYLEGQKLPPLVIDLQVRKKKDERTMLDFQNDVYEMVPEYREFWETAKKQVEERKGLHLN